MKNSAWYHKLWRKKLSELTLKEEDEAAWANMRALLDEQLPVDPLIKTPASSSLGKLFKGVAFIIVTVVLLGVTAYWLTQSSAIKINRKQQAQSDTNCTTVRNRDHNISGNKASVNISGDTSINASSTDKESTIAKIANQNIITAKSNLIAKSKGTKTTPNTALSKNSNIKQGLTAVSSKINNNILQPVSGGQQFANNVQISKGKQHQLLLSSQPVTSWNKGFNPLQHGHTGAKKSNNYNKVTKKLTGSSRIDADIIAANQQQNTTIETNTAATTVAEKANGTADNAIGSSKIDMGKPVTSQQTAKSARNNAGKAQKLPGAKTVKNNTAKNKQSAPISNPLYNYGLEAGLNSGHSNSNLYVGGFGTYTLSKRVLLNAGLGLHISKSVSGEYSGASYYRPDSLPSFKVMDSRKLLILDIPLTLEYRLSNLISFNAGTVISIPLKQSGINYKYGPIVDERDTVYHTKTIDSTMRRTMVSKVNFGGTVGITFRIKEFNIDARYQVITPYKLSNGFGSYSQSGKSFQIGIGYRFK
ncbi:porin family protein [Mucilaginibacter polytrichastri]|uniref:Outer membrane protein beta-barrel domain-containing protein n=1 Tax=Mucilaginibacter polytrichastri TaxID=1302689 RepID=A0A1Q5ZTK2_9SPHI|nr:hypothetical protein [Mucilaginibacter polytrichastri]OKS85087.1 hypothetical protein RG47T_0526 [Mucilaginibacter polytrichastri]SFS44713.1 hypothetical protein SAMN04487890_101552 [Mucilaginibacter polytrichastri]